ncbi:hypothetical protein NOF04DRAFT_11126 [Fusarium oxysporum II5]|uniref:GRAM domain-containing protein n=1 Tax=Fusarium odoratissimum (strain NRRL 54006) TaxID=1089451 RepID=X0KDF6_FUSO5|nr:uncharacterized protein FOIG_12406 [Fusarium odoratissimum NRRL 54006]EXL94964.1 hypothetical protein FOIG_12406 [Fusarium odoratissimum NRRL 54006]KAK2135839.1 hypothetical protein NOF04DRAFT_11126 [Fusarium oxysporum II5]
MDQNAQQTRHIAANLEHGADGSTTLHTSVQHEPLRHGPAEKIQEDVVANSVEVKDVGWDDDQIRPEDYAFDGIKNKDIWLLIRRFNKRVFHLKHAPNHPEDEMDFNVAEEEQFSPNKLRAQIERLYIGAILGFIMLRQHLSRLQSWREPRRTSCFCLVYLAAWYLDGLMPTLLTGLMAILLSPKIRNALFPPCPPALVHYQDGHLIKPAAGILGTVDTATGAPESLKGETLEREASNFATGLVALSINVFVDKDPQHDESQRGGGKTVNLPDPRSLATRIATAKDKAAGIEKPSWDKSKSPMQELMWSQMRPLMHWVCRFCDVWERSANLLDPTAPFPRDTARHRIVQLILPIVVLSAFTSCYMFYRIVTLCMGIGFFGSIFLRNSYGWLKHNMERIVFRGIPTDSQLTIALLRHGERNKAPLSPPPESKGPPPEDPHILDDDVLSASNGDRPGGAPPEEIRKAVQEEPGVVQDTGGDDHEYPDHETGGKRRGKLLAIVKPVAQAAAKTVIGVNKVRAKTGTVSAKNRVGAASTREIPTIAGPVEFTCRWQGEKGFAYLTTDTSSPCLCFSRRSTGDLDGSGYHVIHPIWMIPVKDITTLNKYSGYGAKAKLLAGWALEAEIMDGLEIVDSGGKSRLLTAMARRDQLFNRLCAIGDQKWEIW